MHTSDLHPLAFNHHSTVLALRVGSCRLREPLVLGVTTISPPIFLTRSSAKYLSVPNSVLVSVFQADAHPLSELREPHHGSFAGPPSCHYPSKAIHYLTTIAPNSLSFPRCLSADLSRCSCEYSRRVIKGSISTLLDAGRALDALTVTWLCVMVSVTFK